MAVNERLEARRILEAYEASQKVIGPASEGDVYLYRLGRSLKYIIVGGALGILTMGALGALTVSQADLPFSSKIAYGLSMALAGMIVGVATGAVLENSTASRP